jgi:hypothetical protein
MTRINCGIPPAELCDAHLLAEHREITRIPNTLNSGRAKVINIPPKFTLGKGHVKFFYNKVGYIQNRYNEIYEECRRREFNVESKFNSFENIPKHRMNDWSPSPLDIQIINERISERLQTMKRINYTPYKL